MRVHSRTFFQTSSSSFPRRCDFKPPSSFNLADWQTFLNWTKANPIWFDLVDMKKDLIAIALEQQQPTCDILELRSKIESALSASVLDLSLCPWTMTRLRDYPRHAAIAKAVVTYFWSTGEFFRVHTCEDLVIAFDTIMEVSIQKLPECALALIAMRICIAKVIASAAKSETGDILEYGSPHRDCPSSDQSLVFPFESILYAEDEDTRDAFWNYVRLLRRYPAGVREDPWHHRALYAADYEMHEFRPDNGGYDDELWLSVYRMTPRDARDLKSALSDLENEFFGPLDCHKSVLGLIRELQGAGYVRYVKNEPIETKEAKKQREVRELREVGERIDMIKKELEVKDFMV